MANLTGISETLLLTLYQRYLETERIDGIIKDEKAREIVKNINLDLSKFKDELTQLAIGIRTEILDEQTQAFLAKNPDAIVVNLAAGLCTRFFRVDNGKVEWYAVDLEQVKPIWDEFIGETNRRKFLAYSALDFAWMDFFKDVKPEKIIFIVEGLSMYLSEAEIKQLILGIKDKFSGTEMLIDAIHPAVLTGEKINLALAQTKATFSWGVASLKELESWDNHIKCVREWSYTERYIERWQEFQHIDLTKSGKIGHLKFV